MKHNLRKNIQRLPDKSGIYFFKSDKGEVIYIGKARSLRERVKSYLQPYPELKIKNILSETKDIDFILTESEREAAFLENNFIRRYQPKFNLRLKDDKSFPYLKLTVQEKFPALHLTRRVEEDGARYFGPFSPAQQARRTIHLIAKYFGIRTCQEKVPGKRKRPCLEYDLKLCSAPCVKSIQESEYRESVENALLFLEGKTEKLLRILKQKMHESAQKQEYEQAAFWRDFTRTIQQIKEKPKLISVHKENKDIFGFTRENENISIYIFLMRKGKVIESEDLSIQEKKTVSDGEALFSFLQKYYQTSGDIPDTLLLPFEPTHKEELSKQLSDRKGKKVEISVSLRGDNKKLVDLANSNAEILLRKKSAVFTPLTEIKNLFNLKKVPLRIEGFDVSNIGGEESVGSLVSFVNGRPQKKEYRKYRIESVKGPNDVASLQEIIHRRYTKLLEEKIPLPNLILVDGGKGQLNAALAALKALGIDHLPILSLAKKEEVIFSPSRKNGVKLERTSPALKLLQNIRDEAHRFAVTFHRLRREKRSFESYLDEIKGVGNKRKSALRLKYNSLKDIQKASLEELAEITGKKAAKNLKEELKNLKIN